MTSVNNFYKAIEDGKCKSVNEFLGNDSTLIQDEIIFTLFDKINDAKMMSVILKYSSGKIMDLFKKDNKNVIIYAIRKYKNNFEMIKEFITYCHDMINYGENLVFHDNDKLFSYTPLMYCFTKEIVSVYKLDKITRFKIIECLVYNGADVNCIDRHNNHPIDLAFIISNSIEEEVKIVKLLIKYGADVNKRKGTPNLTPVLHAIECGKKKEIIVTLIDSGADVDSCNEDGNTPLHLALVKNYSADVVLKILENSTNINAKNRLGFTPLRYGFDRLEKTNVVYSRRNRRQDQLEKKENENLIYEMCKKGAILDKTSVLKLCKHEINANILCKLVSKYKCDVKWIDLCGNCILHHIKNVNLMEICLKRGASININVKNKEGLTPLEEAINCEKHIKVIELLLYFGASHNNSVSFLPRVVIFQFYTFVRPIINLFVVYNFSTNLNNTNTKFLLDDVLRNYTTESMSYMDHWNILLFQHIFLSNENIKYNSKILSDIKFNNLITDYNEELEGMKEMNISDGMSFYDFCFKYYKSMTCNIDIDECQYYTPNKYKKIKSKFPKLSNAIITKIKIYSRLQKRKRLFHFLYGLSIKSVKQSNDCTGHKVNKTNVAEESDSVELDVDCLFNIGYYLSDGIIYSLLFAALDL